MDRPDVRSPAPPALVDLRARDVFVRGHLPDACCVPLEARADWPATGLPDDAYLAAVLPSALLPPRDAPLLVVASSLAIAERVCAALAARGRSGLQPVALDPEATAGDDGRALERGEGRPRLWRPPAFLARWSRLLPHPVRGTALDLACGSGRAAVWLAARGWQVLGLDRDTAAIARAQLVLAAEPPLAAGGADPGRIELRTADLRRADALPSAPAALAVVVRYLQRDFVACLHRHVAPGGIAVLQTFRDVPGAEGPPASRHRLRPGEWCRLLPERDWELLVHEEGFSDDGRPAAGVVARRRTIRTITARG